MRSANPIWAGSLKLVPETWLGGLDSNQDNQIQNLMYCQLYDLPAGGNKKGRSRDPRYTLLSTPHFVNSTNNEQS
jgi:hypothetical protein